MGPRVEKRKQESGLHLAWGTDIGLVRKRNEDSFYVETSPEGENESHGQLLIVADGMGGPPAGDLASALAVEIIPDNYYGNKLQPDGDPVPLLRQAFAKANSAILRAASENSERFGMGTTCTALLLRDADLWLAHVGDSRAYLLREGRLEQLSRDHNVLERMRAEGHLADDDAKPPGAAMLTAALGHDDRPEADFSQKPRRLESGDRLLICSDGLSGMLSDSELTKGLSQESPSSAAKRLIRTALDAGGRDNITVIVVSWEPEND
jgi:PPM family protein phosphatase